MFKKKEKKPAARKRMKNIVVYNAYYPDVNVISTREGYAKCYELADFEADNAEDYEAKLSASIVIPERGGTQIVTHAGRCYMVVTIRERSLVAALAAFSALSVTAREVPAAEWFSLIAEMSTFAPLAAEVGAMTKPRVGKPKPSQRLIGALQPYYSEPKRDTKGRPIRLTDSRIFAVNGEYVRTLTAAAYPGCVCGSILTEVLRIPCPVTAALYLRRLDKAKCLDAFERFPRLAIPEGQKESMKAVLASDTPMVHAEFLVSVRGKTVEDVNRYAEDVEKMCGRYILSLNALAHQQQQAFASLLPLGVDTTSADRVLPAAAVCGLTPLSWAAHVARGVSYGTDTLSRAPILYSRAMTRETGFVLGSDPAQVVRRMAAEVKQMHDENPNIRALLLTTNTQNLPEPVRRVAAVRQINPVCDDPEATREAFRLAAIHACGFGGRLSPGKRSVIKTALDENPETFAAFAAEVGKMDAQMGRQLGRLAFGDDTIRAVPGKLTVVKCGAPSDNYAAEAAMLLAAAWQCDADVIYILNAEAFAEGGAFRILSRKKALITYAGEDLPALYAETRSSEAIQAARFVDICPHTTYDRVRLRTVLAFTAEESAALSDGNRGVLYAGDTSYIYTS